LIKKKEFSNDIENKISELKNQIERLKTEESEQSQIIE
jgi:hypothetical protein